MHIRESLIKQRNNIRILRSWLWLSCVLKDISERLLLCPSSKNYIDSTLEGLELWRHQKWYITSTLGMHIRYILHQHFEGILDTIVIYCISRSYSIVTHTTLVNLRTYLGNQQIKRMEALSFKFFITWQQHWSSVVSLNIWSMYNH